MKKIFKNEQSGRSMVEMLGVLAIIGVLSVGGIAGYSKAMAKFKLTKAMDQLTMLLANIRTTYAGMQDYAGLTTKTARDYQLAPADMFSKTADELINAFGGTVLVGSVTRNGTADMGFAVVYNGLTREACIGLSTSDWGTGIDAMSAASAGLAALPAAIPNGAKTFDNLPMTLADANTACASDDMKNSVTWFFY